MPLALVYERFYSLTLYKTNKNSRQVQIQSICRWKKTNVTKNLEILLGSVEIIVPNEENGGHQHIFFFPHNVLKSILSQSCQKL